MSFPSGENSTHFPFPVGNVHGLVYFVPKPLDCVYAVTNGVVLCATAMSFPSGENATQFPVLAGSVHGLVYFVQKPLLRWYAVMNGVILCATAMSDIDYLFDKAICLSLIFWTIVSSSALAGNSFSTTSISFSHSFIAHSNTRTSFSSFCL